MPRYTVHVRGEWLAVPCKDGKLTVGWLGREAVRRYMKNKPDNGGFKSVDEVRFLVRRCKGLGLLDNDDLLEVALEDNEFVEVSEWLQGNGMRCCGTAWKKSPLWAGTMMRKIGLRACPGGASSQASSSNFSPACNRGREAGHL